MKYELGSKSSGPGCCMSSCEEDEEKMYYPSLYISGDKKIERPEEGTAIITFRKIDSGENTRDPEDPQYRCELEVHSIEVKDGSNQKDGSLTVSMEDMFKNAIRKKVREKMGDE